MGYFISGFIEAAELSDIRESVCDSFMILKTGSGLLFAGNKASSKVMTTSGGAGFVA